MAPVPRRSFRRRLRSLSVGEFRRFVAALWEARGYAVTDGGALVEVERAGQKRTIAIEHRRYVLGRIPWGRLSSPAASSGAIDTVVVNTRSDRLQATKAGATSVVGVDELYDIVLYAIPRSDARELLGTHLGLQDPFAHPSSAGAVHLSSRISADESTGVRAIVLGLVLAALVGTAGGLAFLDNGAGVREGADPTVEARVSAPTIRPTATATPTATPRRNTLAPGVDGGGVFDAANLADAHRAAITGGSYTWNLTYRERYPDRDPVALVETVRVSSPTLYVSDIRRDGEALLANPVGDREIYADDQFRFERVYTDSGIRYRRTPIDDYSRTVGRNANRAARYVQGFLAGEESRVVEVSRRPDGSTYYTVRTTGDPRPRVTDATTIARIDSTGLVYALRRTHRRADRDDVTVVITLEYADIGNTSVEPPPWYRTAWNETG